MPVTLARRLRVFAGQWQFHVLLLPAIILTIIFHYWPLYGIVIAFQKYSPALGFNSPWVGLANFTFVLKQPNMGKIIYNTMFIAFFKILGGILVPVLFSLLLNEVRSKIFKRGFQTLVYLPNFLSWIILAGVFNDILANDGILNQLLASIGIPTVKFLSSPAVFPWTMIVTHLWKGFGFGTVIYLAALTSIDPGLYEAAICDGATRWKQTVHITIPMIMPTIVLMTVLSIGGILSAGFDQIFNMYSPIVYSTGDVLDTYVYRLGIEQAQFSIGAAIGLFCSLVGACLMGLSHFLADRLAGYRVF